MKMEGMKAYILNLGEGSADANLFKANTTIASVFTEIRNCHGLPIALWLC